MNHLENSTTSFSCEKCGHQHKLFGTEWKDAPLDPNLAAARIARHAANSESPLPADAEAAWDEWSKSIKNVDKRGRELLRSAFEAGFDVGKASTN